MANIAFITEGVTDQIVLEEILTTYLHDDDLLITRLQPIIDETDRSRMEGGWSEVLNYAASQRFKEIFQSDSLVIIQIDTDVAQDFGVSTVDADGASLSHEDVCRAVQNAIVDRIGAEFFAAVQNRVVFAISVHSIECWFLPYYYPSDKSKRTKDVNCKETLNPALQKKHGFTIAEKRIDYYQKIAREAFGKKKGLLDAAKHQVSLQLFLGHLDEVGGEQQANPQ